MATTSLLFHATSSSCRSLDSRLPLLYARTFKSTDFSVSGPGLRDHTSLWHRKVGFRFPRASPLRGSITDVEEDAGGLLNQKELLARAEGPDAQQSLSDQDNNEDEAIVVLKEDVSPDHIKKNSTQLRIKADTRIPENKEGGGLGDAALKGGIIAVLLVIGAVGGFGVASYIYRDQINTFLLEFSNFIEGYGVAGYALFVAVYAGLEVLAIPAIPLTMSAGLLFGTLTGTIIVSLSGTIAATAAFLIARYLARDRILKLAEKNKKFLAIDKAIGENSFRVVALLRLSPLLPFSLGNYLYGLTSVKLVPYVVGSWLGMLPGTWAYVSAGAVGRALIQEAENPFAGKPEQLLTLGGGILITLLGATYVTRLAKDAIKDIE